MLESYIREISKIAKRGDAREESYYSALKILLENTAEKITKRKNIEITVLPKKTDAGNPDFRVWDGKHKIVGYTEAKVPGENLAKIEKTEQLERYLSTFPNLLLTDFYTFRWYREGSLMMEVQIGRPFIAEKLKMAPPIEHEKEFERLITQFFDFSIPSLTTAKQLAIELAKRTRFLRDEVITEELREGEGRKDLIGFFEAFKKHLIASLTEEDFADLYAQTITYGLFVARHRFDTTPNLLDKDVTQKVFNRDNAYKLIPHALGILQDVFRFLSSADPSDQLKVMIEDIAEVLAESNLKKIEQEFFHARKGRDPIVHFYETFLAHYDPAKRERRGVYYTPEPVVSYIVRSLNHLLKEEFGKSDGFASSGVTVLDPAAGTMTFLATAMSLAAEEGKKYGEIEPMIRDHFLKNFYAFELMMAPYVIGHLKMSYVFEELGYKMNEDERSKLYLTNTLEWDNLSQTQIPHLSSLSEESKHAAQVKKDVPIMVIMGNPPYSGISENKGEWITKLIEDYKQVDGKHFGERRHWLGDDYVKFIRFAQWKIDQAEQGIVGMITNHGYLDNPTFRGMRQSLMNTFTDIYVLDLHGNSLKKEKTPEGGKDENVFDIQQGVTIALFVKNRKKKLPGKVHHAELWGEREKKYQWLEKKDADNTKWLKLEPNSPFYFFIPKEEKGRDDWETGWKVSEIFPLNSTGIVTARDGFVIALDKDELQRRMEMFRNLDLSDEIISQTFSLKDTRGWKMREARERISKDKNWQSYFQKILYRPFDERWIYYTPQMVDWPRHEVMPNMFEDNRCLLTMRQVAMDESYSHAGVTSDISDNRTFYSNKGILYCYPLYIYPSSDSHPANLFDEPATGRRPNISEGVFAELKQKLKKEPNPEEFFYYIYAILYSPEYRNRYAEFLKSDFPRIPITSNAKLFSKLAELGQQLIDLHLLKSKTLEKPIAKFEGGGAAKVETRKYDEKKKSIAINNGQRFVGIAKEIWEYQIGGYQVLDKWLKDRKGRTLSSEDIRHYCRVAMALAETVCLQQDIDGVIEKNGGWPIR
ncbi:N-6 DNA methylase [Candidatus Peregrinibacteria bacterium]|nr:N-6 DNA methylase [Candidatus Peregrinibacteria bacterium]